MAVKIAANALRAVNKIHENNTIVCIKCEYKTNKAISIFLYMYVSKLD